MQRHFRLGEFEQGLSRGILMAGEQLAQFFPHSADDINELTMRSLNLSLLFFITLLLFPVLQAQEIPKRPSPARLVNDLAEVLSAEEERRLERFLVDYDDSTSTQIVVLTVASTYGEDIVLYGSSVGENWGVGQEFKDNGIILVVAVEDRSIGIATAYGIEEYMNAAATGRIIDEPFCHILKMETISTE